jgi:hypothetical protein
VYVQSLVFSFYAQGLHQLEYCGKNEEDTRDW